MAQYLNLKPVDFDNLSTKAKAAVQWAGRCLLPKWDGCLVLVGFMDGKPDFILSRDNKPVRSMDHIYEDIAKRWPEIVKQAGGVCFIGEAWVPDTPFAEVSGMYRRHSPQLALSIRVFDVVDYAPGPVLSSQWPYSKRLGWLRHFQSEWARCNAYFTEPILCESEEHALRYARSLKALGGYDGCVASNPDATYAPGSGSNGEFLKVKPLMSFTLEVVGVAESTGAKTGRPTVALQVRFKGGVCGVGTGFTNNQAALWWNHPHVVIGRLIEVECMDVYDGPTGMMREPRFVGFRTDVTKADY